MAVACDHDRAYFATHPQVSTYLRPRIPGEFGSIEGEPSVQDATHVQVVQDAPGYRRRMPIALPRGRAR
jgi:hypothetical protein